VEWSAVPNWISAVAATVAAGSLILTLWQVRVVKTIAMMEFEDSMGREYRELVGRLPAKALLGESLSDIEHSESIDEFIHYIDLCSEQIFLRRCKRICDQTWEFWRQGIETNLTLVAFARAWNEVKDRSSSFNELRRLEREEFRSDPAVWS